MFAEKDHELIYQFIVLLQNKSFISNSHVVDCFRNLMIKMSRKMSSIPLIYSHIAGKFLFVISESHSNCRRMLRVINRNYNSLSLAFAAHVICEGMLSLSEVADATENGKHFPLMLITLQNINKNLGKTKLIELFNKSSVRTSIIF